MVVKNVKTVSSLYPVKAVWSANHVCAGAGEALGSAYMVPEPLLLPLPLTFGHSLR